MPDRRRMLACSLGAVILIGTAASALAAGVSSSHRSSARAAESSAGISSGPLATGFVDPHAFSGPSANTAFSAVGAAGGSVVRIVVRWRWVAPDSKPADFDATDPADPRYNWTSVDAQVRAAIAKGLSPIIQMELSPAWAERGTVGAPGTRNPDPVELARFGTALATRYGGAFLDLPRVRYWMAWNEPNLDWFLMPQFEGENAVAPGLYRAMVNEFAAAVHAVHADNLVVAGGMTPFGDAGRAVWPLRFMREMLCVGPAPEHAPTCSDRVNFDVWTHHPYANGGPTWATPHPDESSIGELAEMRRLLLAAKGAGHIVSREPLRFWVTEFSWDTSPPDPEGVPAALHARWVAEGLYRMWENGVSLVTWFTFRDEPVETSNFQSGLWYRSGDAFVLDKPKPALQAFRFPFVAFARGSRAFVWGRTPTSEARYVIVEQHDGGAWRGVARLRANRYGIFMGRPRTFFAGDLRARMEVGSETSVPFSLTVPPDFVMPTPFGKIFP